MKKVKQKKYSHIEIDQRESDILILWQLNGGGVESNVIQIEREKIPELIKILQHQS